jgi:hypothetical protein
VERTTTTGSGGKPARKIEHYWLCDGCSQLMRIGVLDSEPLLIYSDPDGTVINTEPIHAVDAA